MVITDKWVDEKGKPGANSSQKTVEGDFEVIYDEQAIKNAEKNKELMKDKSGLKKNTIINKFFK